jgi:hypothetical protein
MLSRACDSWHLAPTQPLMLRVPRLLPKAAMTEPARLAKHESISLHGRDEVHQQAAGLPRKPVLYGAVGVGVDVLQLADVPRGLRHDRAVARPASSHGAAGGASPQERGAVVCEEAGGGWPAGVAKCVEMA